MEQEKQTAALCIIESKVKVDRAFQDSLCQQVSTDEEYGGIVEQLQDPATPNEMIDQLKNKYRIKQGVLKIHQEDQNKTYQYWRTVIPDHHGIKMQVLKEIHCVPYLGHPRYVRTLDLSKQNFYWKQMSLDVRDFVMHCPLFRWRSLATRSQQVRSCHQSCQNENGIMWQQILSQGCQRKME